MASTLAWVRQAAVAEITGTVTRLLPDLAPDVLLGAVERYKTGGIWPITSDISVEAFERLRAAMLNAGAITREPSYSACVAADPRDVKVVA